MKFNNIPDFIDALQEQISEISESEPITSATSILDDFSEEEMQKFDMIADEAKALFTNEGDITEFIYNRLLDLGYDDDKITKILDHEGF